MRHAILNTLLLAACTLAGSATAADCLRYDYREVSFKGTLVLKTPETTLTPHAKHRNPTEKHAFLVLDKPICTTAGSNTYESGETNQSELTLYTEQSTGLAQYAGKAVTVSVVLIHAFVADAHTPLMVAVKRVAVLAK